MPVATYTVADASSAQIAIAFKWRVIAPSDVTAAPTSDFSGNAYPSGTGAIAANASPRQAAFQVETLPNTAVTTDRSFDVEIYDVTPAGTTLTVSKVRTKIVEDDTSTTPPPSTNIFGPSDTPNTTLLDAGTRRQRHSYVNRTVTNGHAELRIGFDAQQQNGVIVRHTTATTIALYKMVSGVVSDVASVNYQRPGGFVDGDVIRTDVLASGNVVLYVNDTAVNGGGWGVGNLMAGNYARIFNHEQASGVIPSVTIATNNL